MMKLFFVSNISNDLIYPLELDERTVVSSKTTIPACGVLISPNASPGCKILTLTDGSYSMKISFKDSLLDILLFSLPIL